MILVSVHVCVSEREKECVCLSMHSRSVWLAMWMGPEPICVGLSKGSMREKGGPGVCVCVCVQTPKPCQRVMRVRESVWEIERGLGHVRWSQCLCTLPHDEQNAPLPFLPRSHFFRYEAWKSSQEMLPLSPISQSPTAIDSPFPVPKQAGKKSAMCITAVSQPFTDLGFLALQREREMATNKVKRKRERENPV